MSKGKINRILFCLFYCFHVNAFLGYTSMMFLFAAHYTPTSFNVISASVLRIFFYTTFAYRGIVIITGVMSLISVVIGILYLSVIVIHEIKLSRFSVFIRFILGILIVINALIYGAALRHW
jgi:hypothetical protein